MNLLAFFLGRHDSSVAASIDGKVRYAKSERITGVKHHCATLTFVEEICRQWNLRPDAIAFTDGNRQNLGICPPELLGCESAPVLPFLGNVPTFCVDHHYAHVLSTWPVVPSESVDVGFALDGNGDNGFRWRIFAEPGRRSARAIHSGFGSSFGRLLDKIGMLMQLGGHYVDMVGKVMGAQAYGEVDLKYIEGLDLEDMMENHLFEFITAVPWRGLIPEPDPIITGPYNYWVPRTNPGFFSFDNPSFRDWLATVHYAIELYVERLFLKYATPGQVISYAGGCAQNVVCNERLFRRFSNLNIAPQSYDGGLSLGCLEYLRLQMDLPPFSTKGFPYWQDDNESSTPSAGTIERVAELLAQGKIVGWMQGRGEIGPRALGHRSILLSPTMPDGKEMLNRRVKHRETWRPYAPSVLQSHASDYFEMEGASPFMLRSIDVKPSMRSTIPSVVHVDGTARVQTVPEDGCPETAPFSALLEAFRQKTGVPMLLNTSLNAGGSPIFATRSQSLEFFNSVPMDAICIGQDLYVK